MIRVLIRIMILFIVPFHVFSQNKTAEVFVPKLSLRFNFLGLADPLDNNLSLGLEHRFNSKWSTGTDAAWVYYSEYISNAKSSNGLIVRPFVRLYPGLSNTFWEAELHYKYVSYKMEDWLGRMPVDNVPTYEEFTKFNLNKHAAGIHFKWGIEANLSKDKRFRFEYTNGLGIRFKWHHVKDGVYSPTRVKNSVRNATYIGPVFPISCRLVYVLK